jgi:hypothetical protein
LLGGNLKAIHQYLRGPLRGENLASVVQNESRLRVAGPAVHTLIELYQPVLGFHGLFDQAHIILFFKAIEREDTRKDRPGLDADKDGSVDLPRDGRAILGHDFQVDGMLIHLADERRGGDGERIGVRRLRLSLWMFETRAGFSDRWLLRDRLYEVVDLPVRRRFDRLTFAFGQLLSQGLNPVILVDRLD